MTVAEGRPKLKSGCRLSAAGDVLLIPEGALKLAGPASRIVQWCDGTKTVPEIVNALLEQFPGADLARVSEETVGFIRRLAERGAIEYV